ncbi:MAG: hypothetical protein IIZ19_06950, partial [Clostridia bacterium]|nr:hypothetical protein [Clostridia bacterium]
TRASQGVIVMTLKAGKSVTKAQPSTETKLSDPTAYRIRKLPSSGYNPKAADSPEQLSLI